MDYISKLDINGVEYPIQDDNAIPKSNISQSTGDSPAAVMSQKTTTEGFAALGELSKNKFLIKSNLATPTVNGVTFSVDKSSIMLNGTANGAVSSNYSFAVLCEPLPFTDGEQVTLSVEIESGTQSKNFWLSMNQQDGTKLLVGSATSVTFAYNSSTMGNLYFYIGSGITLDNLKLNIQIESGERTVFIPYGEYGANDRKARQAILEMDEAVKKKANAVITEDATELSKNKFLIKSNLATPTVNGVTFSVDKSSIMLNGTANGAVSSNYSFAVLCEPLPFTDGEQVTLSVEIESGTQSKNFWLSMNQQDGTKLLVGSATSVTFAYNSSTMGNLYFYIGSGITLDNLKLNIQIESGERTVFIPYGEYRAIDNQARYDVSELKKLVDEKSDKSTSEYIMDKAVAVSDTWKYTVGDGTQMVIDEARAIVYVLYNTSETAYGENHDILALSVFPLKQPWRAKFFEVARIGETYGDYTITHIQDENLLMLDDVVRIFFDANYDPEQRAWLYVDFNKSTMEFSTPSNIKMVYGENDPTNMTAWYLRQYTTEKGYSFPSLYVTLSSNLNVYDGVVHAMLTGTDGIAVYTTSSDNGITWELKGIVDTDCQFEAMVAKVGNDLYVWCRPKSYFVTDVSTKMWKSTDNGETFEQFDFHQSSNTRAQLLTYKDNLLVCHSGRNTSVPTDACVAERNNLSMWLGAGTDKKLYKLKESFVNRFGILYYAIRNYRNVLYMAYVSNDLYMSDGSKNLVYFTKIGEFYTDDTPNELI